MTAKNAVQLFLLAVLTVAIGIPAIVLGFLVPGRSRKGRIFRLVSKSYSWIAVRLFGVAVETRGLSRVDRDRPYVFMSNHVSHIDSPALALSIPHPLFWVFKKELSRIPVFGWVLLALGQVMVDRDDLFQARGALAQAASWLGGNNSILIYPEGTRSRDGTLRPLKKGGFFIAVQAGVPIVPVRVSGSRDIVPSGSLAVRPGRVVVELFDPIPTAGMTGSDIPLLMQRVRSALLS